MNQLTPQQQADLELARRIRAIPALDSYISDMLELAEDAKPGGGIVLADDAELRAIEIIRGTGKTLMQSWAEARAERVASDLHSTGRTHKDGKKKSSSIQHSET